MTARGIHARLEILPREIVKATTAWLHCGTTGKETGPMFPMKKPIRLLNVVFQID